MTERLLPFLVNAALRRRYRPAYADLTRIEDLAAIQTTRLRQILTANAGTSYGARYGFATLTSVEDYQDRVPQTQYESYRPYLERISDGEPGVLTAEPVLLLEPSSGSTSASKLIPYTAGLKAEFQEGLRPWLYDLYSSYRGVSSGKSYWSVTPATAKREYSAGGIGIGFDDDREYFGSLERRLMSAVLVAPEASQVDDASQFYHRTALALLRCGNLSLISVWNPSLLLLLLDFAVEHADQLVADVAVSSPRRAAEVRRGLASGEPAELWPRLTVISCWADAAAAPLATRLSGLFPDVVVQPKGLLATEGFVSLPLAAAGGAALSARSHFFEFEPAAGGAAVTADRLEPGCRYGVVLTTSGGLYRYQLGDLVDVTGWHGALPVLRFVGKHDQVSDLVGEKLHELFVRDVLGELGLGEGFAMLAPETKRYVLYTTDGHADAGAVDTALRRNFHYDYCRKLGQLLPLGQYH